MSDAAKEPKTSKQQTYYAELPFFLVRAPLLPLEKYYALGKCVDDAQILSEVVTNPLVMRAMLATNPTLYRAAKKEDSHSSNKKLAGKLLRILTRMSTRSTPVGMYAGVALARWDDETNLRIAETSTRIATRLDAGFLSRVILPKETQILRYLDFQANPTIAFSFNRFFLAEKAPFIEGEPESVSIEATTEAIAVLQSARAKVSYNQLDAILSGLRMAPADIYDYVAQLVEKTFLLTSLRPDMSQPNPAERLIQLVAGVPKLKSTASKLKAVQADLENLNGSFAQDVDVQKLENLLSTAKDLIDQDNIPSVQVDMLLGLQSNAVAKSIARQTCKLVDLLVRIGGFQLINPHLELYKQRFLALYEHREVPLLEVLNPQLGLGFPLLGPAAMPVPDMRRRSVLTNMVFKATLSRSLEIDLDEHLIEQLSVPVNEHALPASLDVFVNVLAKSAQDLDAGNFVLADCWAVNGAGRSVGRFAEMLGPQAKELLMEIARREQQTYDDRSFADLVAMPRALRLANVGLAPKSRQHAVVLDSWRDTTDGASVLELNDLLLGVRENRFYLRSVSKATEVRISVNHLVNEAFSTGTARFLSELSQDGVRRIGHFDWGTLGIEFPFLPRIKCDKFILSPAQWAINTAEWQRNNDKHEALQRWRNEWFVPRYLYIVEGDNRLLIDLDNPQQVRELLNELGRKDVPHVRLQEVLVNSENVWCEGSGGHYATEFVVPVTLNAVTHDGLKESRSYNAGFDPRTVSLQTKKRAPGTEWLYAKLYCSQMFEEELIAKHVSPLAAGLTRDQHIDSWFFVRYADPFPHVRIRFKGQPALLNGTVHKTICAFADDLVEKGICMSLSFDTYEREVERYGGVLGIDVAERLFSIDSEFVSAMSALQLSKEWTIDRIHTCAYTSDRLLEALGLSTDERLPWYKERTSLIASSGDEFRKHKEKLLSLFSGIALQDKRFVAACEKWQAELREAFQLYFELDASNELSRNLDFLRGSLVHMHCNRSLGINRVDEERALALAHRALAGVSKRNKSVIVKHGDKARD